MIDLSARVTRKLWADCGASTGGGRLELVERRKSPEEHKLVASQQDLGVLDPAVQGRFLGSGGLLLVGLNDVIDVDVTPATGDLVDDPDLPGFAVQFGDVPVAPLEQLVVLAGRGSDDLVRDEQLDAGLARVVPTPDQESDSLAIYGDWLRSLGGVSFVVIYELVFLSSATEQAEGLMFG